MPAHPKPSALQVLLPILIFAAVGIGLWFVFPDLRVQNNEVASRQETSPPIPASAEALVLPPETAVSVPPPKPEPPVPPAHETPPISDLDNYPLATHTWGDTFNPQKLIPTQGYLAWYFNTNQPKQPIARETVGAISINYIFERFHGIPSEDFGAYWAGRLHVPQRSVYRISADMSWSKMRVMLNRHIIAEAENGYRGTSLLLEPGDYLLEVEYINNWHTTNFQLNFAPVIEEIDDAALPDAISAKHLPAQTVAYAVNVHGSDAKDNRLVLQAPAGNTPYILILSSYNAVRWELQGRAPQLVIYNNAHSGSTIRTAGNVPQIAWEGNISIDVNNQKASSCRCTVNGFYCGHGRKSLKDFADEIQQLTGLPLRGYSRAHNTSYLPIPQTVVDAASIADNARQMRAIEQAWQACTKRNNAGFEEMMQR